MRDETGIDVSAPITLSLAPDVGVLASLRRTVSAAIEPDLVDDSAQMFLVAITEAVTNAIEIHRDVGIDDPIAITIDRSGRKVTIDDQGGNWVSEAGADGPTVPDAAPGPEARRGRGLVIMQAVCPGMRIIETNNGTRIELPYPD